MFQRCVKVTPQKFLEISLQYQWLSKSDRKDMEASDFEDNKCLFPKL